MPNLYETSKIAEDYVKFRPVYTKELAERVMKFCRENDNATDTLDLLIDVGCGSGQSSSIFQPYFKKIVAIDISKEQLKQGRLSSIYKNIQFKEGSEKNIPADDRSVDMIVSGASAHWFDLSSFFKEAKRVLKPNGCLSIFGYWVPTISLLKVYDEDSSRKVTELFEKTILESVKEEPDKTCAYTLLQRRYEDIFQAIPFSTKQRVDGIHLLQECSVNHVKGYMKSSDSYQPYIDKKIADFKNSNLQITQDKISHLDYVTVFLEKLKLLFDLEEDSDATTLRLDYDFFILMAKQ